MRTKITDSSVEVWLSKDEIYEWSRRWPGSTLRGHRLWAQFDRVGDPVALTIDGGSRVDNVDSHEFNACIADHLNQCKRFPKEHPLWFDIVGRFLEEA